MIDFTPILEDPDPIEPDWDKPSRAVVANNAEGKGVLLWAVGAAINSELEAVGSRLDDLGLDDAPEGISVWEGRLHGWVNRTADGEDYDSELRGEFRDPTEEEWASIRAGLCPWNPDDYLIRKSEQKRRQAELDATASFESLLEKP